MEMLNTILTLA